MHRANGIGFCAAVQGNIIFKRMGMWIMQARIVQTATDEYLTVRISCRQLFMRLMIYTRKIDQRSTVFEFDLNA